MDTSLITTVLSQYVNGDAAYIAVLTFFLCEAIFAAFPIERSRMKQLTSLLIGGGLGLVLLKNAAPLDNLLQGLLAGGGATMFVAKFKGTSSDTTQPETPIASQPVVTVPATPQPIEHL